MIVVKLRRSFVDYYYGRASTAVDIFDRAKVVANLTTESVVQMDDFKGKGLLDNKCAIAFVFYNIKI